MDDLTFETDLQKYNQIVIYPQIVGEDSDNYLVDLIYPEVSKLPNSMVLQKLNQNFRNIFNEKEFKQNAINVKNKKIVKIQIARTLLHLNPWVNARKDVNHF